MRLTTPAIAEHAGTLLFLGGRDPLLNAGGVESYVVASARTAQLAGYRPHILCPGRRSETIPCDFGTLHRVRSPVHPPRTIFSMLQRPFLLGPICSLVSQGPPPRLIHALGPYAVLAMAAAERLAREGIPVVTVATVFTPAEHEAVAKLESRAVQASRRWRALMRLETAWVRSVTGPSEARAYRRVDAVVVNYESVHRLLREAYGELPVRRLTYCAPTAFEDLAPVTTEPADRVPRILSLSRHDGRKGLEVLIDALARLRDDGVSFCASLVGPGVLLNLHRRLVRSLDLEDRVEVPGRVPSVAPYLREADIYVLPSREEGSGSVGVLEAMQAGLCIVASAVDGVPEDLTHDEDGVLVESGESQALASALRALLDDPGRRERLGQAARRTYQRRFSPQAAAADLERLYTELGFAASRRGEAALTSASAT